MKDTKAAAEMGHAEFIEEVKRTVCLDYLAPHVNKFVIKTALDQFGKVMGIRFLPKLGGPPGTGKCASVEMKDSKQATNVIASMKKHVFLISGMPRPVSVSAAVPEMFENRPRKPKIFSSCRWVNQSDPAFKVVRRLKFMAQRHKAEIACLLEEQAREEKELEDSQYKAFVAAYRKLKTLNHVMAEGCFGKLARIYGMHQFGKH